MNFDTEKLAALLVKSAIWLATKIRFKTWQPGEKLCILLIGYNGKQNTGSDARVESMARQFFHILGEENVNIGVVILDEKSVDHYFPAPIKQERISSIFFWPLLKVCSAYHMAILSEGCCLKSKFSNALLLYFLEGVGIAKKQNKPCLAYGVEAGYMDRFIARMTRETCNRVHFIARTQPSLDIVRKMNLTGEKGTDTAWIFKPAPSAWAKSEYRRQLNWDTARPIVGVSVINPFCWPVKPDIKRFIKKDWLKNPMGHYKRWYFFSESDRRKKRFQSYLRGIATAVDAFARKQNAVVAIFGMEALDLFPCQQLQRRMQTPSHVFSSCDYDGYKMTSLLRNLSVLVTSRYHARVLSMPTGVPSIAISMDERLYNLMAESNHLQDYYIDTKEPHLDTRLAAALEKIWRHRDEVRKEILNTMPSYLRILAGMGMRFSAMVGQYFPQFPLKEDSDDWTRYLPPLDPELQEIVGVGKGLRP